VLLQRYEVASPGVSRLRAVAERQDASSLAAAALRVLAAQELIGLTLGWAIFLLSQHPRVLADVEQEIAHVCGDRAPALADLDELRLMGRVLRETQRLFPPLAVGARMTTSPITLGSYTLPAGATIIYSPTLNQRADTYVAPLRFRPERWLYLEPTAESFHPFGLGPDLWEGEPWATLQLKLILARMLQRYRLALAPHETITYAPAPLLAPRNGIAMIIGFRDRPLIVREPRGDIRSLINLR
jgi:cytochrome P450